MYHQKQHAYEWEQNRFLAWIFAKVNCGKDFQLLPADIYHIPLIDPPREEPKKMLPEDKQAMIQRARERMAMFGK